MRVSLNLNTLHVDVYERARTQLKPTMWMAAWWVICVTLPVLCTVFGALYGALAGAAAGAFAGMEQAKHDLSRWWDSNAE